MGAGIEPSDGRPIKGQGNHPNSKKNLQSQKKCPDCKKEYGNKKGSACGNKIPVLVDGVEMLDEKGNPMFTVCKYVFQTAAQKKLRDLHRKAMLADEAKLPDAKRMRFSTVERVYTDLVKKVRSALSLSVALLLSIHMAFFSDVVSRFHLLVSLASSTVMVMQLSF